MIITKIGADDGEGNQNDKTIKDEENKKNDNQSNVITEDTNKKNEEPKSENKLPNKIVQAGNGKVFLVLIATSIVVLIVIYFKNKKFNGR